MILKQHNTNPIERTISAVLFVSLDVERWSGIVPGGPAMSVGRHGGLYGHMPAVMLTRPGGHPSAGALAGSCLAG